MLSPEVHISHLDGRHMEHWWKLLIPPGMQRLPSYAILVCEDSHPIHLLHSQKGVLPIDELIDFHSLEHLRNHLKVDFVLSMERQSFSRWCRRVESQLSLDMDFADQGVLLWRELREIDDVKMYPNFKALIPPLRSDALQKCFDLLIPDQRTLVFYLFDEEERQIYASAILHKDAGDIDGAYMHPLISDLVSEQEIFRNWKEQYSRIHRAVESRLDRAHIAIFADYRAALRVLSGPGDQLSKEIRARNIIVDPAPPWLQGLLGGAAVAAVATRSAKRMARFLPTSARRFAGDIAGAAQAKVKDSAVGPFAVLGFDPIELIGKLRAYYR